MLNWIPPACRQAEMSNPAKQFRLENDEQKAPAERGLLNQTGV